MNSHFVDMLQGLLVEYHCIQGGMGVTFDSFHRAGKCCLSIRVLKSLASIGAVHSNVSLSNLPFISSQPTALLGFSCLIISLTDLVVNVLLLICVLVGLSWEGFCFYLHVHVCYWLH